MALTKLEEAMVILDCGDYFVATLNMSTHVKKSENKGDHSKQKEELKKRLKANIFRYRD